MNKNKKYVFYNLEYTISIGSFNAATLINQFIADISKNHKKLTYVSVAFQLRESASNYFTIGDRYALNPKSTEEVANYIDYIQNKVAVLNHNKYSPSRANTAFFNYILVDKADYLTGVTKVKNNRIELQAKPLTDFSHLAPLGLPLNTNYLNWGSIVETLSATSNKVAGLTVDAGTSLSRYIEVTFNDSVNRTVALFSSLTNVNIARFSDRVINHLVDHFIRQVGNHTYHIKQGKVFFIFERLFGKDFITKLRASKKFSLNLMTLDIETYVDSNKEMQIYCVSFFDGKITKSFHISNYKDVGGLVNDLLSTLFTRKYNDKIIYIHNSSEFDLIFLLKYIVSFKNIKVDPIVKDGKFINLDVRFGPKHIYSINFRDSMLLLSASLSDLGTAFKVNSVKDIFPHSFVNAGNLNYIGDVPAYSYFDQSKVTLSEYQDYVKRFNKGQWDLRAEAVKYCELDCKSLYEVIMTFANFIYSEFSVNLSLCPTLPSLAFRIFRTHFLPKGVRIPAITGKVFDDLSKAYYGGHVDMYIPTNPEDSKVYQYDVNALYPSAMRDFKYPTNIFAYFKGDITKMKEYEKLLKDSLGVYKVNVITPKGLANPILPVKMDNATVYGEGTWTGWYCSSEIDNAIKFGYKFEVLEGYLFEAGDVFSKYIDKMNEIKEGSDKGSPNYMISKLLMNSLYGRFAMSNNMVNHEIVKKSGINDFISKIGLGNVITKLDIGDKTMFCYNLSFVRTPKINMGIAAAISANGRVHMSQFKNNPDYILYYSDTDSAFINKPLPPHLVDNKKLGFMKLEQVLTKLVALGPKVYGGIDLDGNQFTKAKGLKTPVSLIELESLLNNDNSLVLNHDKWFSSLDKGTIAINPTTYDLKPTDTKRNLVYKNGILVGTSNKTIGS